jgi:LmbE family N-acetylglucosaminyl deacetylase
VSFTLVSFHAHPDDEALLTGGTLARASAEGHRVVLVTATLGEAGLAANLHGDQLAKQRHAELEAAARAVGAARVVVLGYPDSGSEGEPPEGSFAALDPAIPARRLADLLREEHADALTIYDPHGGYGHPDHVQVHRVGLLAAREAGTPVVLEATVDRRPIQRVARILARIPRVGRLIPPDRFATAYTDHDEVTHRVDVRPHLEAKRTALAAHATQAGGAPVRTVQLLLALPRPLARRVLGREWFREIGRPAGRPSDDIFDSLRSTSSPPPGVS